MEAFVTSMLLAFTATACVAYYYTRKRRPGEPPLISHALPFLGGAINFGKDPMGYLKKLQKTYGDIFTIELVGWNCHVVLNPLDVSYVEKCKLLTQKPVIGDFASRMLGKQHSLNNIYSTSLYDKVKRFFKRQWNYFKQTKTETTENVPQEQDLISKLLMHNLRGLAQLNDLFNSCAKNTIKMTKQILNKEIPTYDGNNKVNLRDLCQKATFYLAYDVMFGSSPSHNENKKEVSETFRHFTKFNEGSAWLVDRIPIHLLPETKYARRKLLNIMRKMDWSEREYVSIVIKEVLNADTDLEHQARHMLITLWASQSNTIEALFWALFYILKTPQAKQKIMNEYKTLIQSKREKAVDENNNETADENCFEDIKLLEREDLNKLSYLDSTLKEVLRVAGSNMNVRKAMDNVQLKLHNDKVYNIRKGDYVIVYTPFLHYDEEIYENPKEFQFDRFVSKMEQNGEVTLKPRTTFDKSGTRINSSHSILTFGFGGLRCPGKQLALIEMKMLILTFLSIFDLKLGSDKTPDFDLTYVGFGVMPPNKDVSVSMTPKAGVHI